nr:pyridoxal-phosphate dependent enzyme [Permianibacter fluminis]
MSLPVFSALRLDVRVLREDLRDPELAGNKARKLQYNLIEAHRRGAQTLVSMGGAYSNHLHALALAGRRFGFATAAFVRGPLPPSLSPTLRDCGTAGMQLIPLSRTDYRQLRTAPAPFMARFEPTAYWLPEGGSNALAIAGLKESLQSEAVAEFAPELVLTAAGTGATMAGLAVGLRSMQAHGEVWAVAVLKGGGFLLPEAKRLLAEACVTRRAPLRVLTGFHFGGYGRRPDALQQFCQTFFSETGLPVEPVYTGRVCYALQKLARQGVFRRGQRILLVHTGGLQGARP